MICLEHKLKVRNEEIVKKKQLLALMANLNTILWEGLGWKPIPLADVLYDSKMKRAYHGKTSEVMHPNKTRAG